MRISLVLALVAVSVQAGDWVSPRTRKHLLRLLDQAELAGKPVLLAIQDFE